MEWAFQASEQGKASPLSTDKTQFEAQDTVDLQTRCKALLAPLTPCWGLAGLQPAGAAPAPAPAPAPSQHGCASSSSTAQDQGPGGEKSHSRKN